MTEPRQTPGTMHDRSWSTRNAVKLGFLMASLIFAILLGSLAIYLNLQSNKESRQICMRLDASRAVEYRVLVGARESLLQQAAIAPDPAQALLLTKRAAEYKDYVTQLRDSVEPYIDTAATEADHGTPHIDCAEAFPLAAPASWFESVTG